MAKIKNTNLEIEEGVDLSANPDPLPKIGDTVNYVTPGAGNKIVPAKVIAVDDTGRSVKIEIVIGEGDNAKKKIVTLPHRPVSAVAGNTWHWPTKAAAMLFLLACLAIALTVRAAIPTYHSFGSAAGTSSTQATIIMPADPNSQIRIVNILYKSDNAAGQLSFSSGLTAYSVGISNTVSAVTNLVNSTNGLNIGSILVLQHGFGQYSGITDYTNSVSSWGTYISGTNTSGFVTNQAFIVTPAAFSFGASTYTAAVGDNIYLMTNGVSWYVGATTNAINGDDIYSGNYGRPVQVLLGPATAANALSGVSTHYDSSSQP